MRVVAVGFKVMEENSVFYRKITGPNATGTIVDSEAELEKQLGKLMLASLKAGSEFVSVRFIK